MEASGDAGEEWAARVEAAAMLAPVNREAVAGEKSGAEKLAALALLGAFSEGLKVVNDALERAQLAVNKSPFLAAERAAGRAENGLPLVCITAPAAP